jgi:hypothetical protein
VKKVFGYNFSVTQKGRALNAGGHFPPLAELTNDVVSSCGSIDTCTMTNLLQPRQAAIEGIESFFHSMLVSIANGEIPTLSNGRMTRRFTPSEARSFTSIVLVYSYVYALLKSNRTTTTREIYYFHQDHFSSQRECDDAILDAANLLGLPRVSLGIYECG